jgi:hypothetical protein
MLMKLPPLFSRLPLLARLGRVLAAAAVAAAATSSPQPAAADQVRQLVYRVVHATYGDIGTYRNLIETAGDRTTVKTTVHLKVTVLGMVLHQEDAERTEQWQNNRLISFHGVTNRGGKPLVIDGEAKGDKFVITSPLGTFAAPASVQPANPWSANCLRSTAMMRVDTGRVESVTVSGGQPATVDINGADLAVREYQIGGRETFKIWIDRQGTPVKFSVDDKSGEVDFEILR